jgi:hypothetical protein
MLMALVPARRVAVIFVLALLITGMVSWQIQASLFDSSLISPISPISPLGTPTALPPTPTPRPLPAPVLFDVMPDHGPVGSRVYVIGDNFAGTPIIKLGEIRLTNVERGRFNVVVGTIPPSTPAGTYDVRVINPDGKSGVLEQAFTVTGQAPVLLGLMPTSGVSGINTDLLIYGYNLRRDLRFALAGGSSTYSLQHIQMLSPFMVYGMVPDSVPAGLYDLTACTDQNVCSRLSDAFRLTGAAVDDFSIGEDDLWTLPRRLQEGQITVTLGAVVHRRGGTTTERPIVAFYQGDPAAGGTFIGSARTEADMTAANGSIGIATVPWHVPASAGPVKIYASVDPNNALTGDTNRDNNIAHRTFTVLSAPRDNRPPTITDFKVDGGEASTSSPEVTLTLAASDDGGSGLASMLISDRVYSASAEQWVSLQQTGWVTYSPAYTMTLAERGGLHFLQAWVADRAGNVSLRPAKAQINYLPSTETIGQHQVRVYRDSLAAGEAMTVTLTTLSGDADLLIWDRYGTRRISVNPDLMPDELTVVGPGNFQIEVYGYLDSTYRLQIVKGQSAGAPQSSATQSGSSKDVPVSPSVDASNEPSEATALPMAPSSGGSVTFLPIVQNVILPIPPSINKVFLPLLSRNLRSPITYRAYLPITRK